MQLQSGSGNYPTAATGYSQSWQAARDRTANKITGGACIEILQMITARNNTALVGVESPSPENVVKKYMFEVAPVLISLSLFAFPQQVIAAETDVAPVDGTAPEFQEIVVTGEKFNRSLFETLTSVAVTTGEDIEDRDIQSLQDIIAQTPNVNQQNGGEGFTIRGVSSDSVTGAGTGPLATLYIDGAQISELGVAAGQLDLWDIAQVEIFRGAQSLIQGRNSLAGSIHIRSKDPIHGYEVKGRAQFSEYDSYNLSAAVNVPVISDQVALRVGIDHKESDGFITNPNIGGDDYAGTRNTLYRAKLLVEPASVPDLRAILTVSYSENRSGDDVVDAADPFRREVYSNILGREDLDQFIATLELDYQLGEAWHLTSVSSFNDADYSSFTDDDQSAAGGTNSRLSNNDIETFSQELRLRYNSDRLNGHFGFYYLHERQRGDSVFTSGLSIPALLPPQFQAVGPFIAPFYPDPFLSDSTGREARDTDNYAAFFDFDFKVNDLITLHAGLRYDREELDNDIGSTLRFNSALPDVATVPSVPLAPGLTLQDVVGLINGLITESEEDRILVSDTSYTAWLPKGGVTFNWNDNLSTSLVAQRGYRAGGAGVSTLSGVFEYDPEYTWTYEAILRAKLFNGRAQFRANIFYTDWTDQQVLIEANPADFIITNAGKSEYYGFEAQLDAKLAKGLNAYFGLGYVKTEFLDFTSPQGNFNGNEFSDAPGWSINAGATYRHASGLFAQANINYQDSSFNEVDNILVNDGRTLVNAKIGYEGDNFTISAFARNLFNSHYITRNILRTNTVKVGDPQIFGGEVSFRF